MIFKIIAATIAILLCAYALYAMTLTLNPGTGQVVITNWDWIRCDGKELRIWVNDGSITVSGNLVIGK